MKKLFKMAVVILLLSTLAGGMAACQPGSVLGPIAGANDSSSASSETATPTLSSQEITPTPGATIVHDEAPLEIEFPTPGQDPVSSWRPPLESAPWALGPYDHFYFMRPIPVNEVNWPLANYRYGYYFPDTEVVHTGVDIDASLDTPILAAASGKVVWAGYGLSKGDDDPNDPYGIAVAVRHDFGYEGRTITTIYAHMSRTTVQVGQYVEQGDQLGVVGVTGFTTGPHLHFEIRLESPGEVSNRNPELWIVPPQGLGILVGRFMQSNGDLLTNTQVNIQSESGRIWTMYTYAGRGVHGDDYYKENMVLSDLPEGSYTVSVMYGDKTYRLPVEIHSGAITYFQFKGDYGYIPELPATPNPNSFLTP